MPWCVPGRAFVLGTALNKLHPVTLTPSEFCDRALPRPFVTRGWGLSTSPMASSFYSLYSRMPTCSSITFALRKFCINLVVSSTVKLMPSPMMNTSGSQRLTSGTHTLEASTLTLYTRSGANKLGKGGGVGTPTYMAQNDAQNALIILSYVSWGGGGIVFF